MDRLRREEIEEMRRTPPEEKARQALELMRSGIALKRVSLRLRHPDASEEEIDALLDACSPDDRRCAAAIACG